MSFIGPDITMCGPLWAAMQVVVVERFKNGKKAMNSFFGGAGLFPLGYEYRVILIAGSQPGGTHSRCRLGLDAFGSRIC
ncbi:hypothetical protein RCO48_35415 [Peribacillus frigoritolerans]|nr:hypothetical protein [Peribacillus frigoritolerans]